MNHEQLNAIKQRTEKATPGPWIVAPEKCGPEGQGVYESDSFGCICEVGDPYPRGNNRPQENMEFIAHAREDVPTLVVEVERLRKELAQSKINQMDLVVDKADEKSQKREYIKTVHLVNEENKRLRKALSYYADEKHYEPYGAFNTGSCDITEDEGYIARQALAGESDE